MYYPQLKYVLLISKKKRKSRVTIPKIQQRRHKIVTCSRGGRKERERERGGERDDFEKGVGNWVRGVKVELRYFFMWF